LWAHRPSYTGGAKFTNGGDQNWRLIKKTNIAEKWRLPRISARPPDREIFITIARREEAESLTMRICVRALVDAGMRQLFRRKTAAPIRVDAVELGPHEPQEFFFRHDAVLVLVHQANRVLNVPRSLRSGALANGESRRRRDYGGR
jgi:hypothetical protein